MIIARFKQHMYVMKSTKVLSSSDEKFKNYKQSLHDYESDTLEYSRNGHLISRVEYVASKKNNDKYIKIDEEAFHDNQYEVFFKPKAKHDEIMEKFGKWLKKKDPLSNYIWNSQEKRNDGIKPTGYSCWCEVIGDFLIDEKFKPVAGYNDGLGVGSTEVWVKE